MSNSIRFLEGLVRFKSFSNTHYGSDGSCYWNNETNYIQYLHSNPPWRSAPDLILCYVHRHWKVYCQWPECQGAQKSNNIVKKWKHHGNQRGAHHKTCPPHQPEQIHLIICPIHTVLFVDELTLFPPFTGPSFNKCKQWWAENLHKAKDQQYSKST